MIPVLFTVRSVKPANCWIIKIQWLKIMLKIKFRRESSKLGIYQAVENNMIGYWKWGIHFKRKGCNKKYSKIKRLTVWSNLPESLNVTKVDHKSHYYNSNHWSINNNPIST